MLGQSTCILNSVKDKLQLSQKVSPEKSKITFRTELQNKTAKAQRGFIALGLILSSMGWAMPDLQVLSLPFKMLVVFEGKNPGQMEERTVEHGFIQEGNFIFQQREKTDLLISGSKIKGIIPIYPDEDAQVSIGDLQAAVEVLKAKKTVLPEREEVSNAAITKWQKRIDRLRKDKDDAQRTKSEEIEAGLQKAAERKAAAEFAAQEADRTRKNDLAKEKIKSFQGLSSREEVLEAMQACAALSESDLANIPDYKKAKDYWDSILALPVGVAMPSSLDSKKNSDHFFVVDSAYIPRTLIAVAWLLFLIPLVLLFHSLTKFIDHVRERVWISAGAWMGTAIVSGGILYLIFSSGDGSKIPAHSESSAENQPLWAALTNVKDKDFTRFAEKYEVPAEIFLREVFSRMRKIDGESSAFLPKLAHFHPEKGDSGIVIRIEVPLKWFSIPISISFAVPLPNHEISLKVTGGRIGSLPLGTGAAGWFWEQISPLYQAVPNWLGLDQGVKIMMLHAESVVISIPEVHSRIKSNP
jgi:hypothetical protein